MSESQSRVSRKSKAKKKPRGGAHHPEHDPYHDPIPGEAACARRKLDQLQEYRLQKPTEVKKLAVDLTNAGIMKSVWFATGPEDDEREGEAAPAVQRGTKLVAVELFLARPQEDYREHTFTGSSPGRDSVERRFERFCSYGMCTDAAIRVDDVYLKWEPNSLVIPKGTKIKDENEAAQPISIGDELPRGLGESENLDQLLQLVAEYNGTHFYKSLLRNSKVFVRDALHRLEKDIPPLLVVFENYRQRISDACEIRIQKNFASHKDLDEYYKHSDHETITRNKRNVEYLFFMCVCFHVKSAGVRVGVNGRRGGMCTERNCCFLPLLSDLPKDELIFDGFWQTFTANGGH